MKFLAILLSFLVLFLAVSSHQTVIASDALGSGSAATQPTPMMSYTLPYPGILPNNPLYALKVFRDRLILFFIASPAKKASFYLLQSDKRLAASQALFSQGGNDQLALDTLSKSTNYLQQALESAKQAQQNGDVVTDIDARLLSGVAKHINVVMLLSDKTSSSVKAALVQEEKRLSVLQKSVAALSSTQ